MMTSERVTIHAGHGKAARLDAGQSIKLINTPGTQVVDFWAFNAYDLREYMCVEASRVWSMHLWPTAGDVMVTTTSGARSSRWSKTPRPAFTTPSWRPATASDTACRASRNIIATARTT